MASRMARGVVRFGGSEVIGARSVEYLGGRDRTYVEALGYKAELGKARYGENFELVIQASRIGC